jgi:hypothetical protein
MTADFRHSPTSINVMGGKRNGIRGTAAGWGLWSAYEILGVHIMIADQRIEDHAVEQTQNLRRIRARCTAH